MIVCRKDFQKMCVFPCDLHIIRFWGMDDAPHFAIVGKMQIAEYSSALQSQLVMRAILQAYKDKEKYFLLPDEGEAQQLADSFLAGN